MTRGGGSGEQKPGAILIALFMVVAFAIIISRQWFPFFLVGSIFLFIVLLFSVVIEIFFRDHSYLDFWDYISAYIGAVLIFFLIGTGITYEIGYGLGGTPFGKAALDTYYAMTGAQQKMEDSINQFVDESCKTLPEESCKSLKVYSESAETLQDVMDMAEKINSASN